MLTDYEIASVAAATYQPDYVWDFVTGGLDDGEVWVGVKTIGRYDIVAFRGSVTKQDWFRDGRAAPYYHPLLGGVHGGFFENLDFVYDRLLPKLKNIIVSTGHSLGGARAFDYAGLLAARGVPVGKVVTMGAPRPGFSKLAQILAPVDISAYRNRYDPVPTLPEPIPGWPYVQPRAWKMVDVAPAEFSNDPSPWLDFNSIEEHVTFADHHVELYLTGILKTEAANGQHA